MIIFKEVSRVFKGKKRRVKALKNINLVFLSTGLNFIVGESGAGKTTLLNILSLQDRCTLGKLFIDNRDVSTLNQRQLAALRCQYFGIIFQSLNLIEDFSVYQNISIGMEIQKVTPSREEVVEILKRLNLSENILDEQVCNLSGGQKQRVAIARTLIKKPKVIICDEPTGSLDEENATEIMEILKLISKENLVIVVSHSKRLSSMYADRIITLIDGQIQNDSQPVLIKEDKDELKELARTRLPFKSISKLALCSFRKSLPKVIFTMIAFFLSLAIFMISMTIFSFDKDKALEETLISENVTYFNLQKYASNQAGITIDFDSDDLTIINEFYKDKYILSTNSANISSSSGFNMDLEGTDMPRFFTNNAIYLSDQMSKACDFEIYGRFPQYQETTTEIVLSKYFCYLLGWLKKGDMDNQEAIQKIIDNKVYKFVFEGQYQEFDIVGIIDTNYRFISSDVEYSETIKLDQDMYEMHKSLFFCEEDFNVLAESAAKDNHVSGSAVYDNIYVLTEGRAYFERSKLVQRFSDNEIIVKGSSRIDYINMQFENMQVVYSTVSLILAIFLLVISLFSFMGFITSSIRSNMKTMHILRSLGITSFDSIKVFSFQSFLISVICIILSIIPYAIGINQINIYFRSSLYTSVSALNFSFLIIFSTFLGMVIVSVLITVLWVLWSFRKKKIIVRDLI